MSQTFNIQSSAQEAAWLAACRELDTASLSDALDSLGISGGLGGIAQRVPAARCVGLAYTVRYEPVAGASTGFRNAANYIDDVPANAVIVSANEGRTDCTVWGDILTTVALRRKVNGTVIDGAARDLDTVSRCGYPLFSRGVFMQSGKNRVQLQAVQVPVTVGGVIIHPGDLIAGDANGVVAIPAAHVDEVIRRARSVEHTERRIVDAVSQGHGLAEARRMHRYDQPWLTESSTS